MSLEEKIRIIPHRIESAASAMALDRTLLRGMENYLNESKYCDPVLRTYQFSNPTVILGYHQKLNGNFNSEIGKRIGASLTIRDTGGGHMYFGQNDFHFSFLASASFFKSENILEIYKKINQTFVDLFRPLGYSLALGKTSLRYQNAEGKLVAGTALRKGRNAFLHQAGFLVDPYTPEIFSLIGASEEDQELWKEKVLTLKEINSEAKIHQEMPSRINRHFTNGYIQDVNAKEIKDSLLLEREIYNNQKFISSGTKEGKICLISGSASTKNQEQEVMI